MRHREDKPSWLNLLSTKGINLEKDINHECPYRRIDNVVIEIEIKGDIEDEQEQSYKKKRINYAQANCTAMKFIKN